MDSVCIGLTSFDRVTYDENSSGYSPSNPVRNERKSNSKRAR